MDEADVRVSDAERQAVVDRLSAATGDGLITLDEFAEHAGRAYAAVTRGQLDAVTLDLRLPVPVTAPAPAPAPAPQVTGAKPKRRWIVAVMGGEERKGRWRAGRRIGAAAVMGGVVLDLRDALLESDVVEITAWAVMGGVNVIVPEGIPVESSGFVLMGGRSNRVRDVPTMPGAPTIRVKGYGLWGGVDVRSKARRGERADEIHSRPSRPSRPPRPHRAARLPAPPPPAPPAPPPPPWGAPVATNHDHHHGLVTIVCTDLVGSTRLADVLGDQRWRDVVQAHNAIVRQHLAGHGGTEIKTSGDGFLCTFTSARRAVAFAVDLQDAIASYRADHPDAPLELRVGVHAGEVERDGDDVVGRNVSVACRLCDAAAPNEVLASATVADLADSASDLAFGDGRQLTLAGIDRPVTARPAQRR